MMVAGIGITDTIISGLSAEPLGRDGVRGALLVAEADASAERQGLGNSGSRV